MFAVNLYIKKAFIKARGVFGTPVQVSGFENIQVERWKSIRIMSFDNIVVVAGVFL